MSTWAGSLQQRRRRRTSSAPVGSPSKHRDGYLSAPGSQISEKAVAQSTVDTVDTAIFAPSAFLLADVARAPLLRSLILAVRSPVPLAHLQADSFGRGATPFSSVDRRAARDEDPPSLLRGRRGASACSSAGVLADSQSAGFPDVRPRAIVPATCMFVVVDQGLGRIVAAGDEVRSCGSRPPRSSSVLSSRRSTDRYHLDAEVDDPRTDAFARSAAEAARCAGSPWRLMAERPSILAGITGSPPDPGRSRTSAGIPQPSPQWRSSAPAGSSLPGRVCSATTGPLHRPICPRLPSRRSPRDASSPSRCSPTPVCKFSFDHHRFEWIDFADLRLASPTLACHGTRAEEQPRDTQNFGVSGRFGFALS